MAQTVAVSDVITRIREMADMENTQFVTDAEILRRLNQSYRRLYNEIVSNYIDYFVTSDTITTVVDQDDYSLPSDFYKLVGVDVEDDNQTYQLKRYNFSERNRKSWAYSSPLGYILYADKLRIIPTPSSVQTLTVWYIPSVADLTSVDSFNAYNGWDQFVVEDVAVQLLAKEESDTTQLERQRVETKMDLLSYYKNYDAGNAIRMRDLFDEFSGESDIYGRRF